MSSRRAALTASAAGLPIFALLAARFNFVADDAFISFRYARNLAEGLGLRYNLGVEPPVEGYSNFLWVLLMAAFERVGADVTVASRVVSFVAGGVLVAWAAVFVARRVSTVNPVPLAAALFLATLPPMDVWSTGGLATMPFALTVFACFNSLLGDPAHPRGLQAGGWALTAALLRTDGAYWGALILGVACLTWLHDRRPRLRRAIVVTASILATGVALHMAWRYSYHGDWISNTARVKVGLSLVSLQRGLQYVLGFVLTVVSVGVLAILSPLTLRGRHRKLALQILGMIVGTFAYAALVGGDFMAMGRLLVPAMPFLAVLCAVLVERVATSGGRRSLAAHGTLGALTVLSLLPSFNVHPVPRVLRERVDFHWNLAGYVTEYERWRGMRGNTARWSLLGRALEAHTRPGESLVFDGIGAVGYYSGLFIYDQYGLTDRGVAARKPSAARRSAGHDKWVEPEFFLPREPTYLYADLDFSGTNGRAGEPEPHWPAPYREERIPLEPALGFPENVVLTLVRRQP